MRHFLGDSLSHRDFIDNNGEKWDVWLVLPTSAERRKAERRRALAGGSEYAGEERRGRRPDRRLSLKIRQPPIDLEFRDGWLCFESHSGEKRRLMPVPENWENMPVRELLKLWSDAKRVVRCGIR